MLRSLIHRKLDAEEKKLGESVDYLREVVDVSPALFLRFASIMPFANSRSSLPKDAWYTAQLVALRHEDCGTCLQIGVNLARQDGVPADLLRAVLDEQLDALSQELVCVYRFTEGLLCGQEDPSDLRHSLREHYGERGLIELSFAIASSRIPPTVKRALGFATSCQRVEIKV